MERRGPKGERKSLFLTNQEVADLLEVTPRTILRMIERGEIPRHCFHQAGQRGTRRFFSVAVSYFEAHGDWPATQLDQARWHRESRDAA